MPYEGDCALPRPPTSVTAAAAAGVGLLVAATVAGELVDHPSPAAGLLALDVAIGVLGCALMPLLLRRPVLGCALTAVLVTISPAVTPPAATAVLHAGTYLRFRLAAAAAAVVVASQLVRIGWRPVTGLPFGWAVVLVVAVHAALLGWGARTQARRALVASLRERARRAEDEQARRVAEARLLERTRIAREMHDVLAHRLSLLATYAGALAYRTDAPAAQVTRAAEVIRAGAHQALEELREVIGVLRAGPTDPDPAAAGAVQRPQPTLADLPQLVRECRDAGLAVDLDAGVRDAGAVPAPAGRAAYRIAQEGLTNARKHAPSQPVRVAVSGGPGRGLAVEVRNPLPREPPAPAPVPGSGTGLIGLAERVQLCGGQMDYGRVDGGQFRLRAWLPWQG